MNSKNYLNLKNFFLNAGIIAFAMVFAVFPVIANATTTTTTSLELGDLTESVAGQTSNIPQFLTLISYLIGMFWVVLGVIKLKEHVERPPDVPIRIGILRVALGGLMLGVPYIVSIAANTMWDSSADIADLSAAGVVGLSGYSGTPGGLGFSILNLSLSLKSWPQFIALISYLLGIIFVIQAVIKFMQRAQNPNEMPAQEPVKYFVAGGLLLALPLATTVLLATLGVIGVSGLEMNLGTMTTAGGLGLDAMLVNMMNDIALPLDFLISVFAVICGVAFAFIGIQRLTKTEREGPRGPLGLGTLMTFLAAGVLLSASQMVGGLSATLFGVNTVANYADLFGSSGACLGLSATEITHIENVITASIIFFVIIGFISFVRGWLLLKAMGDGGGQVSMLSVSTHIIAGVLLINAGPLLNAVQKTLNVTGCGINFS